MQVLDAVARQLEPDRIELEQQVVAERAYQGEAAVLFVAELFGERAQDGKRRGLLAAFLFRKQRWQGFQTPAQRARVERQRLPVRVRRQHSEQHPIQHFAALVQRPEFHRAPERDDLEQRAHRPDVPARIPSRILVPGGEIEAALAVEFVQQVLQPPLVRGLREGSGNRYATPCVISELTHAGLG